MRVILQILTQPGDSLAQEMAHLQSQLTGVKVEVVDLNLPQPDYDALVARIFNADSVQVW